MSDLLASVNDGKLVDTTKTSTTKSTKGTSELGKDEFLQLLVTQMKYQDPLNPSSDTEYVSQLATFSQLEQMQNLNSTTANTQAFSLVGKEVVMTTTDTSGNQATKQGVVDFVTMSGKKTYLSIENKLYSIDDLDTVISDSYIIQQKIPSVTALDAKYEFSNPKDIAVKLSLGVDEYKASSVAVVINSKTVETDNLSYKDGTLTINKKAFADMDAGKYEVAFVFNDFLSTKIADKVSLTVTGIKPETEAVAEEA